MAVGAKYPRHVPLFCRSVLVPAQLLAAHGAKCRLFLAKDITQVIDTLPNRIKKRTFDIWLRITASNHITYRYYKIIF